MSQERKGVAMTGIIGRSCRKRVFTTGPALARSIGLWAQTTPPSAPPASAAHSEQPAQSPDVSKAHDSTFVIGNDDVLAINVWKEPDVSRSVPVRSDGKISLPLVGEVQAAGQTTLKLEQEIAARLKNYVSEPEV